VLSALGPLDLSQQRVGELDDFGCLDQAVEANGAVAERVLVRSRPSASASHRLQTRAAWVP
jgi:hypothetical protein